MIMVFRIQRKEKIKTQMKDFETLQKTNPEEALKKLEQLEKTRAEERVTLRHKSTGHWAKNKLVRAKYDKDVGFLFYYIINYGIIKYYLNRFISTFRLVKS